QHTEDQCEEGVVPSGEQISSCPMDRIAGVDRRTAQVDGRHQRPTSWRRRLIRLMRIEMVSEKIRYAPINSRTSCGAGYPFPINWKTISVTSLNPMAMASEVFFT